MLAVEEALERILAAAAPLPAEATQIADAFGRATGEDLIAQRTVPPWDNSAMDGYAVRSADVAKAPVRLRVIETIYAGQLPTRAVAPGESSRIMTGAPMPSGADAVVMQERTEKRSETEVEILEAVGPQSFVRGRGEDVREGETLLRRGSAIGVAEAALLWSQGFTQVQVPRRPRLAILSTGDELSTVESAASGKIIDSNSPALALAAARGGATATFLGIAKDSAEALTRALSTTSSGFDAVLTIGGVSAGAHDYVRAALAEAGVQMDFWKVAIKPGKPLAFGRRGATLFFGLPGNPTSSLVSFELFVRPAIRRMLGHAQVLAPRMDGRTEVELRKPAGLTHFIRAVAHWRDGDLWAKPLETQSSGAIRSMVGATHLIALPSATTQVAAGGAVALQPLSWQG
jgi:molybdopterin molybdotransferase